MQTKEVLTEREWRCDPDAEKILRDIVGIPFIEGSVRLVDVDWSASANNCARLSNPLNAEKIEDYSTCMRAGDVFPMIVVERSGKKNSYIILGGNQRAAALQAVDPNGSFLAYIVDPLTSDERELIIRSLNSRHGWGATKEERVEHAVYLVRKHGMHIETVARAMVVGHTTINTHIRAEDERARLAQSGIDSSFLPVATLSAIARVKDDKTRNAIAETVVEKKAISPKVVELVNAVLKSPSRAKTSAILAEFRKAEDTASAIKKSTSKLKKPRRDKFLNYLTVLADFLERGNDGSAFSTLDELTCSVDHDLQNVRVLAAKINSRLQCICEAGR